MTRSPSPRWAAPLVACLSIAFPVQAQDPVRPDLLEAPGPAGSAEKSGMAPVVGACAPAVVHVYVEVDGARGVFTVERPSSGVVIAEGMVMTHRDLVAEAVDAAGKPVSDKRIMVKAAGGAPVAAALIGIDAGTGLALLQVAGARLQPVPLAVAPAAPGQPVVVLSYHDGERPVAYGGVWTPPSGAASIAGNRWEPAEFGLTDAKVQLRNHGGGLFDRGGRLVGLVSAEHVIETVSEPELADLKRPTFGVILPAAKLLSAYRSITSRGGLDNAPNPEVDESSSEQVVGSTGRAVAKIAPAVVGVLNGRDGPPDLGTGDPFAKSRYRGFGSGVVIGASGLVLTNAHLVGGSGPVSVICSDGEQRRAEVVADDSRTNLALLQVELAEGERLPAALLGSPEGLLPGSELVAVGNPTGKALAVTAGVLSAHRPGGYLQADPSLGNHTAGGAVVDGIGRLVGIADGGVIDLIDRAFAQRGDEAPVDADLHRVPGMDRIHAQFAEHLDTVDKPAPPTPEEIEALAGPHNPIAGAADALLNVYVSRAVRPAAISDNPFAAHAEPEVLPSSLGSGVIIDPSGLAVSNWHVVDAATNPDGSMRRDHAVHARSGNGTSFDVRVLSISREDDLALLQLVVPGGGDVPYVPLGNSDAMQLGERVFAVGNPMGQANTVTAGILSAVDQEIRVRGRWAKFEGLMEPDAAINGGNSGGALLDAGGRLAGINSAGGRGFGASGYAIPVNYVRQQLRDLLLSPAKLRSPWLGLRLGGATAPPSGGTAAGEMDLVEVDPHGPAAAAGLQVGDRLVAVAGQEVRSAAGLAILTLRHLAGQPLSLTVTRDGEEHEVSATPWSAAQWAVWKQAGLQLEQVTRAGDFELVVDVATSAHRQFTGDPQAAPNRWPDSVIRVVALAPSFDQEASDVRVGDVIVGVELIRESRDAVGQSLQRFATVEAVQRCFNDPALGSYEGTDFRLWVYRGGKVHKTEVNARRLFL